MRFASKAVSIAILGTLCVGLGLYFVSTRKPKSELQATLPNVEKSPEPSVDADTASPDEPTDSTGSGPVLYTDGEGLWAEPGRGTAEKINFGTNELESSDGTISNEPIRGYVPVSILKELTINQEVWVQIRISPGELYCESSSHEVAKTGWLPKKHLTQFARGC